MTVAELIEELVLMPQDAICVAGTQDGYPVGPPMLSADEKKVFI